MRGIRRWIGEDREFRLSRMTFGIIAIVLGALLLGFVLLQPKIVRLVGGGESITAEFRENFRDRLVTDKSNVKVAGVIVGAVTSIERTDRGTTLIEMDYDDDLGKLGAAPTAALRPNTLLTGSYYVDLTPGGGGSFDPDGVIPPERTSLPVDLDSVLEALPAPTRASLQRVVGNLDGAMVGGARDGLRDVLARAPGTLRPTGDVLRAARGNRPGTDLPALVTNLESAAGAIASQKPALDAALVSLDATTATLARQSRPLAATIEALPATLRETRTGLGKLSGTVERLTTTAESFRPAARQVRPLLDALDPVLDRAGPLLDDLKPLLREVRPAVSELVPASERADNVLEDVRGPVLDRLNGPIIGTVNSTFRGTGPYEGSGDGVQADHKFYEEAGYMLANLDRSSKTQDRNGSMLNFQVGAGISTPSAGALSLTDFLTLLEGGGPPSVLPGQRAAAPVPAIPGVNR